MGEKFTKLINFEKIDMLISIRQPKHLDEVISIEVGEDRFPVQIWERGMTEKEEGRPNKKRE